MTATAIFCFVAIVLAATLRAFGARRAPGKSRRRARRVGAGIVLGGPVRPLDLVGGERRASASGTSLQTTGPGGVQRGAGRIGD